jgi:hypothetical protein
VIFMPSGPFPWSWRRPFDADAVGSTLAGPPCAGNHAAEGIIRDIGPFAAVLEACRRIEPLARRTGLPQKKRHAAP